MKRLFALALLAAFVWNASAQNNPPLRVFIRAGAKTHGPGQHDWPSFLRDWTQLLNERGAKATGKQGFPTAAELDQTDVLILATAEGGTIQGDDRANLEKFLKRGGGIVTLHDAVCGTDPHWFKTIIGGAWEHGKSKWLEGEVGQYFLDTEHPITRGASNFDFDDEIYHDLHMMPDAHILATSFHSVFIIGPQMWTYEKENYRAFTWLAGHKYASFSLPHVRALLLRGIAWAGKQSNVDGLCRPEELGSLKYPPGGPVAPEKAAAKLGLHPEFDINLVVAEPLVEKVISMDWDPQGRLWVAETPEYPGGRTINRNDSMVALWAVKNPETVQAGEKENRPAQDRISWLSDSDGDGRMDRKTVFAEGLELVTSLVFYKDGVIVAQAPDILWLRDTNGDGKCDMKGELVKLYGGFGTFDTHAVINNFRWGNDGWIYSAVGYSAGDPANGDGSKKFGRITAGIIRFKPDGSALEQYASGSCNTWGLDFSPDGEAFYTTATCGEHFLHVVMPEKILAKGNVGGVRSSAVLPDHQDIKPAVKHTRPAYVQIDWVGKFTAAAGCAIYNGGAWPERYNGSHFCSETTMSLVHNDLLRPNGVTYTAYKEPGREEAEFIAGSDLWFRPIHTRVGPDGALYVVDFYNQAAIHNDTRGPKHGARNAAVRPDRDHHFGRVWRIQHKNPRQFPMPKLAEADPAGLAAALDHPNGWVRDTAHRLLVERSAREAAPRLLEMAKSSTTSPAGRAAALWTAYLVTGQHDPAAMLAMYQSSDETVRKAPMKLVRNYPIPARRNAEFAALYTEMGKKMAQPHGRVRLETIMALAALQEEGVSPARASVWDAFPTLNNDAWTESAIVAALSHDPEGAILEAADRSGAAMYARTIRELASRIAARQDGAAASSLLVKLAAKPASADPVKRAVLESFARVLNLDVAAAWTPELQAAFKALLGSNNAELRGAVLPLVARWDKQNTLSAEVSPIVQPLLGRVRDENVSGAERAQVARNLFGVRRTNAEILPALLETAGGNAPADLKRQIIETLGAEPDAQVTAALLKIYGALPFDLKEVAFGQLVKRSESALALVGAIKDRSLDLRSMGPSAVHRLRTHSDAAVAARAVQTIDEIRGPEIKEKDQVIAQFAAAVEQRGDLANGKALFTQNCANCHRYKGEGRDLAPDLTGMGAHGPHDLLVHIVDPNRVVEPNFVSYSIETKDDLAYDGVIARENRNTLVLRNATGDFEIRQDNIQSRRSTGLSVMPNGFESLGADGLRDLIGYLCADETKFRVLDMTGAFTVDSTKGIYNSLASTNESLIFRRFGMVSVEGIPFDILTPTRSPSGKNLLVLKGGYAFAKTLPQKVQIPVGVDVAKLHFLGGVGGWAYPCCGDNRNENAPVTKVTVHFKNGTTEELILKNGVEFADYNGNFSVPGSKEAAGLLRAGQIRWFTKTLARPGPVEKLTLESYDNTVAPTFAAITAETSGAHAAASATSGGAAPIRVLIVGGGTHHDFAKWFNESSTATLSRDGFATVSYTEDVASIAARLKETDVLYLSLNKPVPDKAQREAIFDFAKSGKGVLLVHPALWYNWADWPEYNAVLAGGGSKGHPPYQAFEVKVTNPAHPIVAGLPSTFRIRDELYQFKPDPKGTPIEVLATGRLDAGGESYPSIFVVKVPGTRIVGLAPGHDGATHQQAEWQTLLRNAVRWAAGK